MSGYACIIVNTNILVETHVGSSNLYRIVSLINDNKDEKGIFEYNNFSACYIRDITYTYIVICSILKRRISFSYLNTIKRNFEYNYIFNRHKFNTKDYAKYLKEELEYFLSNENADKLRSIQLNLDETSEIMKINVIKLYERGEKLEKLQNDTSILVDNAEGFNKSAKDLRCNKCLDYYLCCFASCCRK